MLFNAHRIRACLIGIVIETLRMYRVSCVGSLFSEIESLQLDYDGISISSNRRSYGLDISHHDHKLFDHKITHIAMASAGSGKEPNRTRQRCPKMWLVSGVSNTSADNILPATLPRLLTAQYKSGNCLHVAAKFIVICLYTSVANEHCDNKHATHIWNTLINPSLP